MVWQWSTENENNFAITDLLFVKKKQKNSDCYWVKSVSLILNKSISMGNLHTLFERI